MLRRIVSSQRQEVPIWPRRSSSQPLFVRPNGLSGWRAGATDLGFEPRSLPTAFRAPFSFGHDLGSQRVAWVLAEVRLVFPLRQRKGVSGRVGKVILAFKKLGLHPSLSFRGFSRPRPICSIRPADFMTHSRLIAGTLPFSLFFK